MKTNLKSTIWLATLFIFYQGVGLAQTNYDFSTPASLTFGAGGFGIWYTEGAITIDGVSYTLTSGGNGSFSNTSGGSGGSACLRKDGSGGDSFSLKRTDGQPFTFYGIWVKHQSMHPYANVPPYYRITYNKVVGGSESDSENSQNSTRTFNKNLVVKSVVIHFNALLSYWIDDIKVGPAVTIGANTSQMNVACNGGATGSAKVFDVSGGTEPYAYDWTGTPAGDGTPAITGLTAGVYTCTITDAEGYTTTRKFTITQPSALYATTSSKRVSTIGGHDGTATVNVSGGTPGYSYAWLPSGGTGATASGLGAGTYSCSITDANNCSIVKTFDITEPVAPTDITLSAASIDENVADGTSVGTLSTTDGPGDTHTYELVSGEGDADNDSFQISGNKLNIVNAPDYETQKTYYVRIRTVDSDHLSYEKEFTIAVKDLDEDPVFTSSPVITAAVGTQYTYILAATDPFGQALSFEFVGEHPEWLTLSMNKAGSKLTGIPSIDDIGEHVIKLQASNGVQTTNQEFTIGVFGPAMITGFNDLTKLYGDGIFEISDPASTNPHGEFTYVSSDATVASVNGRTVMVIKPGTTTMKATQAANGYYTETSVSVALTVKKRPLTITADDKSKFTGTANPKLTYTVRGFAEGEDESVFTKQPVISTVVDNNSIMGDYDIVVSGAAAANYEIAYEDGTFSVIAGTPSSVILSQQTLFENRAPGTVAGTLTSASEDPNASFTYSLVDGSGSADNHKFAISDDQLKTTASLNYEEKADYSIRVRTTTQHGFWLEEAFTVILSDVNEAPALDAVPDQVVCYTPEAQVIPLSGISSGEEGNSQSTTVAVSAGNSTLFSKLEVNGHEIVYRLKDGTAGIATITVTVTDDGGTANEGTDAFGRSFTLTVNSLPVVTIISNAGTAVSKGTELLLTASGGTGYQWAHEHGSLDGHSTSMLSVRPAENTTYIATVTDENDCVSAGEISIAVKEDYQMLNDINNIMSPNGDGVNDYLIIKNIDMYPNNTLHVFDRAGREVYSKASYNGEWDGTFRGTPLAQDTYYYVVDFGPGIEKIKGFVTIMR